MEAMRKLAQNKDMVSKQDLFYQVRACMSNQEFDSALQEVLGNGDIYTVHNENTFALT